MITDFLHYITAKFSIFTEKLSVHPEAGIFGALQVILLGFIKPSPAQDYESSFMHTMVVILKDLGILAGALLAILTLYVYVKKNFLKQDSDDKK